MADLRALERDAGSRRSSASGGRWPRAEQVFPAEEIDSLPGGRGPGKVPAVALRPPAGAGPTKSPRMSGGQRGCPSLHQHLPGWAGAGDEHPHLSVAEFSSRTRSRANLLLSFTSPARFRRSLSKSSSKILQQQREGPRGRAGWRPSFRRGRSQSSCVAPRGCSRTAAGQEVVSPASSGRTRGPALASFLRMRPVARVEPGPSPAGGRTGPGSGRKRSAPFSGVPSLARVAPRPSSSSNRGLDDSGASSGWSSAGDQAARVTEFEPGGFSHLAPALQGGPRKCGLDPISHSLIGRVLVGEGALKSWGPPTKAGTRKSGVSYGAALGSPNAGLAPMLAARDPVARSAHSMRVGR